MMIETLIEKYGLERYIEYGLSGESWREQSHLPQPWFGIEQYAKSAASEYVANNFYPKIDLSFLSLRSDDTIRVFCFEYENLCWITQLPLFALYSLESPDFELHFKLESQDFKEYFNYKFNENGKHRIRINLKNPSLKNISKSLATVIQKGLLEKITTTKEKPDQRPKSEINFSTTNSLFGGRSGGHYEGEYTLSAPFTYFLPRPTKEKITRALEIFSPNETFIITEVEDWKIIPKIEEEKETKLTFENMPKLPRDPLVIGINNSGAYLIDQFETTPIEQYVIDEFTDRGGT